LRDAQLTIRDRWLTSEAITLLSAGNEVEERRLYQLAGQPDNHRPFAHPRHWAAFICQGDPSPMT
jgi:CHAT domain-containing protein